MDRLRNEALMAYVYLPRRYDVEATLRTLLLLEPLLASFPPVPMSDVDIRSESGRCFWEFSSCLNDNDSSLIAASLTSPLPVPIVVVAILSSGERFCLGFSSAILRSLETIALSCTCGNVNPSTLVSAVLVSCSCGGSSVATGSILQHCHAYGWAMLRQLSSS